MNKLLLLLGPSGVGKSSIIKELLQLDSRFIYISPFITRPLRKGEKDKISISNKEMNKMWNRGKFLVINELYGIRYATPRLSIIEALEQGSFPILDWPISRIKVMTQAFPNQLCVIYILPPSIKVLQQRLTKDGRDIDGHRLQNAYKEMKTYESSQYVRVCDFEIIAEENKILKIARVIYTNYLQFIR